MKKILKEVSIVFVGLIVSLAANFALVSHPVFADAKTDVCSGVGLVTGDPSGSCGDAKTSGQGVDNIVGTVVNILSVVVGLIAVIMIIVSGMRFVLSNGDSNTVNSARSGILYAIVGLVLVAVAQVLVKYVINRATTIP